MSVPSSRSLLVAACRTAPAFSLRISAKIHTDVIRRLLHAPIAALPCGMLMPGVPEDRFFDKHPVGRIMNRVTMDMSTIDLYLFLKISGSIMILFQMLTRMC